MLFRILSLIISIGMLEKLLVAFIVMIIIIICNSSYKLKVRAVKG